MIDHIKQSSTQPLTYLFVIHILWTKVPVGGCILNPLVTLPCFCTFCHSSIPTSCYTFKVSFISSKYISKRVNSTLYEIRIFPIRHWKGMAVTLHLLARSAQCTQLVIFVIFVFFHCTSTEHSTAFHASWSITVCIVSCWPVRTMCSLSKTTKQPCACDWCRALLDTSMASAWLDLRYFEVGYSYSVFIVIVEMSSVNYLHGFK